MGVDGVLDRGLRGAEQIVLRAGREEVVLLSVQLRQAQGDGGRLLALYRYGKCWLGEARQGLLSLALDRGEAEPGDLVDQVAHGFRVGLLALAETFDEDRKSPRELQSLMRTSYAVFCLKNKKTTTNN